MPATYRNRLFQPANAKLVAITFFCFVSTALLPGCGSQDSAPPNGGDAARASAPGNPTDKAAPATQPGSNTTVTAAANGQKMIGDIPYDVWFDDPVGLVNNSQPINSAPVAPATVQTPANDSGTGTEPATATPAATASDSSDWSTIISAETLQAEVKTIRNFLNQKLQTPGQYNSSMFELPAQTAALATLAGIASTHSGEIAWKERAPFIRTIAATMHAEKLQTGPRFQRPLLEKFEQIDEMLSGSLPGGLDKPADEFEFSELADMPFVMKRMEIAFNTMKTEAGSEDSFEKNGEMIQHESAILGAMMKAVLTEGYGYADDEDFRGFAKPIQDSAKKMGEAVTAGSFETYDAGLSAITKSCTQCHNVYQQ